MKLFLWKMAYRVVNKFEKHCINQNYMSLPKIEHWSKIYTPAHNRILNMSSPEI